MVKFHHDKAGEVKAQLNEQNETRQQHDHNKEIEPDEDPRKVCELQQDQVKDTDKSRAEKT